MLPFSTLCSRKSQITPRSLVLHSLIFSLVSFQRRTPATQFPNGLHITSANPNIHSRIERDLGSGNVRQKGCNVMAINSIPNIRITLMELDNSGCQDQGMSQLLKGLEEGEDPVSETPKSLFQSGLMDLKVKIV